VPDTHSARLGSQTFELPVVDVGGGVGIALLITVDHGTAAMATAGAELADLTRDARPELVATAATLGIPVAIEVTRALGIDDYLVLHKSPKIHLDDALKAPLRSITSRGEQRLMLDRARLDAVRGRRVLFVDDVLSTGASTAAALTLLDEAGAEVVGAAYLAVEGDAGRQVLADRGVPLFTLGELPLLEV
jgi:adenine/guanine phosphoribosyltransferase-like PRPP-binding protein